MFSFNSLKVIFLCNTYLQSLKEKWTKSMTKTFLAYTLLAFTLDFKTCHTDTNVGPSKIGANSTHLQNPPPMPTLLLARVEGRIGGVDHFSNFLNASSIMYHLGGLVYTSPSQSYILVWKFGIYITFL